MEEIKNNGENINAADIGAEEAVPSQEQEMEKLTALIEEKDNTISELTERIKRLQADFDNFRRRTQRERDDLSDYVTGQVIKEMLPTVDNFERALAQETHDAEALKTGVEMIYRQLMQAFEKVGVKIIEAKDKQFDPNIHEAVMRVQDENLEDGLIVDEFQKGYIVCGKVIRPSMVKVVSNA